MARRDKDLEKKRRAHLAADATTGRRSRDRDAGSDKRTGASGRGGSGGNGKAAPSSAGAAEDGADKGQGGGRDAEAVAQTEEWEHEEDDGAVEGRGESSELPSDFFVEALDERELKRSQDATPLEVCECG